MRNLAIGLCIVLLSVVGNTGVLAEETLDTVLPPPGLLRRNAEKLNIDAQTRQRIEELYKQKEVRYHQLKYTYERLTHPLYEALVANELDEELIVKRMKSLLEAENALKLYQIRVRISLLSELSTAQRQAVRQLAKENPPTAWRGGIAGKVERIRELSKRLKESGGSVAEVEKQMTEIDRAFAAGNVAEGSKKLDEAIGKVEKSLK